MNGWSRNWCAAQIEPSFPAGGLLVSLSYPIPLPGSQSVFLKLGRRNAMAISRLTVAALGRLDQAGRIAEARLVPGSATPQICRFKVVEESLIGQVPSRDLVQSAARLAADEMTRLSGRRWSSEFKEPTLIAMTARALAQVFETGREGRMKIEFSVEWDSCQRGCSR